MMKVGNNVQALVAQHNLSRSNNSAEKSMKNISTGKRINSAGDDPAGFAISESLRGQIAGVKQASKNAGNAQQMLQTAESGLNQQNNILIRMRELAVQSASDTIGDKERDLIDVEFQQLSSELNRIANTTQFGRKRLLAGDNESYEFHVGPNRTDNDVISFKLDSDTTSDGLDVDGLDLRDQGSAIDSLDSIDEGMEKLSQIRTKFGSYSSRLNYTIDNLAGQEQSFEAARSRIADADVAAEVTNLTQSQIKQDLAASMLAMANQNSQRVLSLIG